ncbi:MAG: hypothetical protein R2822_25085 [Spirosomataceae bacterium]
MRTFVKIRFHLNYNPFSNEKTISTFRLFMASVALAQPAKPAMGWKNVLNWQAIPSFGGTQLSPMASGIHYILTKYRK